MSFFPWPSGRHLRHEGRGAYLCTRNSCLYRFKLVHNKSTHTFSFRKCLTVRLAPYSSWESASLCDLYTLTYHSQFLRTDIIGKRQDYDRPRVLWLAHAGLRTCDLSLFEICPTSIRCRGGQIMFSAPISPGLRGT